MHLRGLDVPRRLMLSAAVVVPLIGLLGGAAAAQDEDWAPGLYMSQAVNAVYSQIETVTEGADLGLAPGVSLFAACLEAGESVEATIQCERGKSYCIVGGGDQDCGDLDLAVLDPDGATVAEDALEDPLPIVAFTADADGPHSVSVRLFATEVPSFCAMAVLAEGGSAYPRESLEQALTKFVSTCGDPFVFHDGPNQFCLYGGIAQTGESLVQGPIGLEAARYVVKATGDADMRDLDVAVLGGGGDAIVRDDMDDEFPAVQFEGSPVMDYLIEVTNVDSVAPSFVVFGILQEAEGVG